MQRTKIYIAVPMSLGDRIENLSIGLRAYRSLLGAGYAPMCPSLNFFMHPFADITHSQWLEVDLPWVKSADGLLRIQGESKGADLEVKTAVQFDIPVFYSLDSLYENLSPLRRE